MVGVWINETHVPLSIARNGTTINSVNLTDKINLFNDNTNDQFNIEMEGFTVTLTLTILVNRALVESFDASAVLEAPALIKSSILAAKEPCLQRPRHRQLRRLQRTASSARR